MPIKDSVKIELVSKLNPTVFAVLNSAILGDNSPAVGATHTAVKKMVVEREHMLKMLMPSILGVSTQDINWYRKVSDYWNSFTLKVPTGGVSFEIGFIYDIQDQDRKQYIAELIEKTKEVTKVKKPVKEIVGDKEVEKLVEVEELLPTITTDAELKAYVMNKINEQERYLYARPINPVDYLNWIYCLGHSKVANKTTDVTKSENIEFTLIDQRDIIELKRANHAAGDAALRAYLEVLPDRQKVNDILYVLGKNPTILSDTDCNMELRNKADSEPVKFVEIVNDKTLTTKARIERYIIAGILKRLPGTSIIVDSSDTSTVIGNTIEEAIIYFKSESKDRQSKLNEFLAKYKQLNKE